MQSEESQILSAASTSPRTGGASFSLRNRLRRLLWNVVWRLLGIWTPVPMFGWRRFLLRCFGARLAATAKVYPGVRVWLPANLTMLEHSCLGPNVDCYTMAEIRLERFALVSQRAFLCAGAHDIDSPDFQLFSRPILIGENAWVAAEAFVGPGVSMAKGSVLGARGVLVKDTCEYGVFAGNPAVFRRTRRVFALEEVAQ